MNNHSQLNNLGEQMKGALNEALETGNYTNLKSLVSDTVTSALNEAGATASKAWQRQEELKRQRELREQQERAARRRQEASTRQEREFYARQDEKLKKKTAVAQQSQYQKTGLLVNVKNNGMVAGILFIVFGALANIPLFVLSIIGMASGWGTTGALLFFLFISVFFICRGKNKIQLISKAKRYVKLCGIKMYAEVEELATQVGISPRKVERELRKILRKGIIPSAHLDKKGTHLMLTDTVYQQYVDAEKARLIREKEEKEQAKQKSKESKKSVPETIAVQPKTELEQMVEEGQECIKKLREMNDLIPGEAISTKLFQLENLLKEIFTRLQKEPAQMNRMHKVMNYYLPTTLKLVEAYHEFDIISNPGEEIMDAKKEIEATLDTINEAFVELLNSLFQDKVMDITTDAQVLQTMLANEGLTREMELVKEKR